MIEGQGAELSKEDSVFIQQEKEFTKRKVCLSLLYSLWCSIDISFGRV
jgi:hypothetical protein